MRTTVSINDSLLNRAKAVSHERGCTLGEVIDDALRVALASGAKEPPADATRPLRTFKGSGLQPGVDLSDSAALLEAMES